MEHESFEDEETARLMNERFVPVKVDREERPDVDGLYMEAVVTMTGQAAGRPSSSRPTGGRSTAAPTSRRSPRFNMPSFTQLLLAVSKAYEEQRSELEEQADALVGAIRDANERPPSSEPLTSELIVNAVSALRAQFDPQHGGFDRAPKFPPASNLELLLRTGRDDALEMVRSTLDGMAAGGMYDVIGGGFHRYSVDEAWLVPHFEKMLYDNALLAPTYLHAWLVTGEERYRRIAEETLDYMVRDLRLPEGGFASAQDADTDGVEGLTYTWTAEELEDARRAARGLAPAVRARPLCHPRRGAGGGTGAAPRGASRPPQPFRDDKAITAWNGMALAAFAEAVLPARPPDYLEVALGLAGFLGRLSRTGEPPGAHLPRPRRQDRRVSRGLRARGQRLHRAAHGHRESGLARGGLCSQHAQAFADPERGGWFVGDHDLVAPGARSSTTTPRLPGTR